MKKTKEKKKMKSTYEGFEDNENYKKNCLKIA